MNLSIVKINYGSMQGYQGNMDKMIILKVF